MENSLKHERTLVLIKPDGVKKKIIGEVIKRFENNKLQIIAIKMIWPDEELAKKHYPLDEEWCKNAFEKTKKAAEKENRELEFSNHLEFGRTLQKWLVDFITESPIIAMVLQGPNAIQLVREIVGETEPKRAALGTIRGDFASEESYKKADSEKRAIRNLIHASDSLKAAEREILTWFSEHEIHNYK